MTRQEKCKWALAALLAAVLAGLLWAQHDEPQSVAGRPSQARRGRRTTAHSAVTTDASGSGVALTPPADPGQLTKRNPFDASKVLALATTRAPQQTRSTTSDLQDGTELRVPEWLKSGKIQGRLRVGGKDMIVVNGRVLRVGDVVDGVEIVRIEDDAIWVRKPSQSNGL